MKKKRSIPFGYKMQDGKYIPDPAEAEIVREIFLAYVGGDSLKKIADRLTAKRIPYTEITSAWNKKTISCILDDTRYLGTEEYAPLFPEGLFQDVQKIRVSKKRICRKAQEMDIPEERIVCALCGSPMRRIAEPCTMPQWVCTDKTCGSCVRLRDVELYRKYTLLMRRLLENTQLLVETGKENHPSPAFLEAQKQIQKAAAQHPGDTDALHAIIGDFAGQMYREAWEETAAENAGLPLTCRFDYHIYLRPDGTASLHAITDTSTEETEDSELIDPDEDEIDDTEGEEI